MVFSSLHLPIVWLLHAALSLCAGSVKFGWVGHGFNGRSWAGACAPRRKRLGHLVKSWAGGKGVLWLNGSRGVRVLQGGGGGGEGDNAQQQLTTCMLKPLPTRSGKLVLAVAQSQTRSFLILLFFYGNDPLLGISCQSVESWWLIFPCTTHEQLRSADEAIFVCIGSKSATVICCSWLRWNS